MLNAFVPLYTEGVDSAGLHLLYRSHQRFLTRFSRLGVHRGSYKRKPISNGNEIKRNIFVRNLPGLLSFTYSLIGSVASAVYGRAGDC